MAKKNAVPDAPAAKIKRSPQEKADRQAAKAGRRATKTLTDDHAAKKASQKQTLKSAAKQLQKELDVRMTEVVARIRKETKAKLKEVVKEATRRLDVDTERMFEQALHTIVRHYDSIAPAGSTPPAEPQATRDEALPAAGTSGLKKNGTPRKTHRSAEISTEATAPAKRAGRPAGTKTKAAGRPGRPRRDSAEAATPEISTPEATANDGVAVDNV